MRWVLLSFAGLFMIAVLSPVLASIQGNISLISLHIDGLHHDEVKAANDHSPYGVCTDICGTNGVCRHILVPEGWHRGTLVTDQQIAAATSCH